MNNYDPAELAKFDAIATRWWDKEREFKPLHDINPLRLEFIQKRVNLKDKKALDVACGGGILSESMTHAGAITTGIDLSKVAIETAKLHLLETQLQVEYLCVSTEIFAAQRPQQFDVVTCLELLEHVPNPASIIKNCSDLTKPGGNIFFSTINRNPKAYLFAILGAEYLLHLLPIGTHDYSKFIRPSELDTWANQYGLEMISMQGIGYNPLNKKYFLSENVSVNYLVHCKKRPL